MYVLYLCICMYSTLPIYTPVFNRCKVDINVNIMINMMTDAGPARDL